MMTPTDAEIEAAERRAFEAWAAIHWPNANPPKGAWDAWLARAALSSSPQVEAGTVEATREYRLVYKGSAEYSAYIRARFADRSRGDYSFEYDGHRWGYKHTSFDDNGVYDLLWRPIEARPREVAARWRVSEKTVRKEAPHD